MVSSLGVNAEETWAGILAGRTGIRKTPLGLLAPVHNFEMNGARSRMGDFALLAAAEALAQAGLKEEEWAGSSMGCSISQSKPLIVYDQPSGGVSHLNPSLLISSFTGWSSEAVVQKAFKLEGPTGNISAACATGVASIQLGSFWIQEGRCDQVLVGAAESSLTPLYMSGFSQMGVLVEGENPEDVCPFDQSRSGFAMGEGAGVLLLETYETALGRGHQPLAELRAVCLTHSAIDPIHFDEEGTAVSRLIRKILLSHDGPDYINAHGTGTQFNDKIECSGINKAFKERTQDVYVSSTKASTGHLLGAAGALEAAITVLALRDQRVPQTLHLKNPDPDCQVRHVRNQSISAPLDRALSLSYGFGGQMGAVLF